MVVVLFGTKMRADADLDEYASRSQRMNELMREIPGFICVKDYASEGGDEVSIARFESEEALKDWRLQPEHVETQKRARGAYYEPLGPCLSHGAGLPVQPRTRTRA
jgi:heme-degrading monooxygenase HmoA